MKHSDELTLGSNNFANTNVSLSSQPDIGTVSCLPIEVDSRTNTDQFDWDTAPPLSLASDPRTDTAQSDWDEVPPLSLALDSRTDTELSILDVVKGPIESISKSPGFVSNPSIFASFSKNESTQIGFNESPLRVLAFIHAMKNIKSMHREEKRLFANLLTLMGHYFEQDNSNDAPMRKYGGVVLTVESLYKTALVIYSNHEIASKRLDNLQSRHKAVLAAHNKFGHLSDDIKIQSDKNHFEDAIADMMTDLEALYLGRSQQLDTIVKSLFKFMIGIISQEKLMDPIEMTDIIELFYLNPVHPDVCSSSTPSLALL